MSDDKIQTRSIMYVESAASIASLLWENREAIMEETRSLWDRFVQTQKKVLVIGAGGVGKTSLAMHITGETPFPEPERSLEPEKKGDFKTIGGVLDVLPGQLERRNQWRDHLLALSNGAYDGVIHVVSWGYHVDEEDPIELIAQKLIKESRPLYEKTGEDKYLIRNWESFFEVYLERSRQREIDVLNMFMPQLLTPDVPPWLFTVVTKEDLWWKERALVRSHYTSCGQYDSALKKCLQDNPRPLTHECMSASLARQNFKIDKVVFSKVCEGYDDRQWLTGLVRVLEIVNSKIG